MIFFLMIRRPPRSTRTDNSFPTLRSSDLDLGEDPKRPGLLKTPERVAKALLYFTHGYDMDPAAIIKSAMFKEEYSQMVIVKDIELYSLCEHHMVPFFGKAHIAYIPNGQIVGLSKIPRIVDVFARRLQVQERLTNEIKDCLQDTLEPRSEEEGKNELV